MNKLPSASRIKRFALTQQKGVTLLEVLIGFVIFCSSLVAILDYVGNHVYLYHQAEKNQQQLLLLYDLSTQAVLGERHLSELIANRHGMQVSLVSEVEDEIRSRRLQTSLIQSHYSIGDKDSSFTWTVFEVR
jgi:Tfp pilus assembly protein PilV